MSRCERIAELFDPEKARRAQELLSRLLWSGRLGELRRIGGVDVSYRGNLGVGALVIVTYPELEVISCRLLVREACVPYIPGLLAFRELEVIAPLLGEALRRERIDLLFVNGHGISHPRRFGLAAHVGLLFRLPTIGVARRKLVGEERRRGDIIYIVHRGEEVAARLGRLYVSPGVGVTLEEALEVTRSVTKAGMPEPLRLADKASKAAIGGGKEGDCLRVLSS